jgi:beta-N-acetylhexosaminidase
LSPIVLIGAGFADFVMIGHLIDTDVATDGMPSSLSVDWITGVLRDQLGFRGVVISDDLEMGAIRDHFNLRQSVVRAVEAGMDVLLFSNTADYRIGLADEIREILVSAARADPVFYERIAESYARIVALKGRIGG